MRLGGRVDSFGESGESQRLSKLVHSWFQVDLQPQLERLGESIEPRKEGGSVNVHSPQSVKETDPLVRRDFNLAEHLLLERAVGSRACAKDF